MYNSYLGVNTARLEAAGAELANGEQPRVRLRRGAKSRRERAIERRRQFLQSYLSDGNGDAVGLER
jgi:hypothetical protein